MYNLSQGLLEEGDARGKAKEWLQTTLHCVKKQMNKNNLRSEEAMDLLDVDNDIKPKILEERNKQSKSKYLIQGAENVLFYFLYYKKTDDVWFKFNLTSSVL